MTQNYVSTSEYVYPWPVVIRRPDPSQPGQRREERFTGRFRLLDDEGAIAITTAHQEAAGDVARTIAATKAHVRAVLVGWDGDLLDAGGRPIPFSENALELELRSGHFRAAVIDAYRSSVTEDPISGN